MDNTSQNQFTTPKKPVSTTPYGSAIRSGKQRDATDVISDYFSSPPQEHYERILVVSERLEPSSLEMTPVHKMTPPPREMTPPAEPEPEPEPEPDIESVESVPREMTPRAEPDIEPLNESVESVPPIVEKEPPLEPMLVEQRAPRIWNYTSTHVNVSLHKPTIMYQYTLDQETRLRHRILIVNILRIIFLIICIIVGIKAIKKPLMSRINLDNYEDMEIFLNNIVTYHSTGKKTEVFPSKCNADDIFPCIFMCRVIHASFGFLWLTLAFVIIALVFAVFHFISKLITLLCCCGWKFGISVVKWSERRLSESLLEMIVHIFMFMFVIVTTILVIILVLFNTCKPKGFKTNEDKFSFRASHWGLDPDSGLLYIFALTILIIIELSFALKERHKRLKVIEMEKTFLKKRHRFGGGNEMMDWNEDEDAMDNDVERSNLLVNGDQAADRENEKVESSDDGEDDNDDNDIVDNEGNDASDSHTK